MAWLGSWGAPLLVASFVVWWASVGCDRDDESTEGEESPAVDEAEGDPVEDSERAPSPYDYLEGVDPVEPTDVGPEAAAIYFLSGLKGYTEPCGCTVDVLLGGIDRIAAYVEDVRKLHPEVHFLDAGDWLFDSAEIPEHLQPQEKAKAGVLAAAYRRMGALFSVPGDRDLALGTEFYLSMMEEAKMKPLAANLSFDGEDLDSSLEVEIDGHTVLFVGAGDPEIYRDVDGVEATDAVVAVQEVTRAAQADAVVLVFQGSPLRAEAMADRLEGVDFAVVGHDPRLDDDARKFGTTRILEAYDQGRYVGRLKLYGLQNAGEFVDGRAAVREERQTVDQQIDRVRRDLRLLEIRAGGAESPMVERLEQRLEQLEQRRRKLLAEGIEIPDEHRSFLYEPVPMEPGYRLHEEIRQKRLAYNESLAELIAHIERNPLPVSPGEPTYVGTRECASCHYEAHNFWQQTAHSSAVATLEARHKKYDQNCIGCHVVGWEKPGGSVLGKLVYEEDLNGETITKDLREVGCESCHGPGSKHRAQPLDEQGQPQHINRRPDETACMQCHVPDHSPTFDFDVYVRQITGEGHQYTGESLD